MPREKSLTPQEVADILKIAKTTVYEMIKRGELPCYRIGRKVRIDPDDLDRYRRTKKTCILDNEEIYQSDNMETPANVGELTERRSGRFVIAGQDISLDILCRFMESQQKGIQCLRSYISSYNGLVSLYRKEIDATSVHLWDEKNSNYNDSYVKYLLPGVSSVMIHIAYRQIGYYVKSGNPLNMKKWDDLARKNITMINREKGSGVRILLDQKLQVLGIDPESIRGYNRESLTHLAVASIVSQGGADVAVGSEKVASHLKGIDFIPLHLEKYELVIRKDDFKKPLFKTLVNIIRTDEFRNELEGLGGYDLSETGKITNIE